jgi:hypothetical protein
MVALMNGGETDFFQYGIESSGNSNILGISSAHPFYSACVGSLSCNSVTISAGTWSFIAFTNSSGYEWDTLLQRCGMRIRQRRKYN